MVDARFSVLAGVATLLVAVLAALSGAWAVAGVFGLLTIGFTVRAAQGRRRGRGS
jgi:hypothetical protein